MKIELLKNAFRGVTRQEEAALAALAIVPRKRRELPVASTHFDTVNEAPVVERAELLALASKIFDPQHMGRDEAEYENSEYDRLGYIVGLGPVIVSLTIRWDAKTKRPWVYE